MSRHILQRRDGTRFELVLGIDHEQLARDIATKMLSTRKVKATRCGGSITATIRELPPG